MKRFILAIALALGMITPVLADNNIPDNGVTVTASATSGKVGGQNTQSYDPYVAANSGPIWLKGKAGAFVKFGYDFTYTNTFNGIASTASHQSIPEYAVGATYKLSPNIGAYVQYGTYNPDYGSLVNKAQPGTGIQVGATLHIL